MDYGQLNPQLGDEADYRTLVEALYSRKMAQIIDIVPNHMSAPLENCWWSNVLENGPGSPFAAYFDIDWRPVKEQLHDKILLPALGDQYGQVLECGELKLEYSDGAFFIRYYQVLLPLDPRTYRAILCAAWRNSRPPCRPTPKTFENWKALAPLWNTCPNAPNPIPAG